MTSSLDMIRGRSNIVTLTNNSGGALIAGDVCVQDATGDERVTTTTSAASVLKVFVAAESIASGATGKFYESGYCPFVNVNASVTRGRFLFTHTVAKQAAENATYGAGAFGKILKSGTTPSAIIYSATAQTSGGGVTRAGSTTDGHLAVWDGSNADSIKDGGVASAGSLVLLEQHTASNSASLDFTTCISSTYDEYIIEFVNVLVATNTAQILMRMNTGSGFDAGTNYGWSGWRWLSNGSGTSGADSGSTSIQLMLAIKTTANWTVCGTLRLYHPGSSVYKIVTGQFFSFDNNAGVSLGTQLIGSYQVTSAVTQFQFLASSGNITSGTIRVYGLAK